MNDLYKSIRMIVAANLYKGKGRIASPGVRISDDAFGEYLTKYLDKPPVPDYTYNPPCKFCTYLPLTGLVVLAAILMLIV